MSVVQEFRGKSVSVKENATYDANAFTTFCAGGRDNNHCIAARHICTVAWL